MDHTESKRIAKSYTKFLKQIEENMFENESFVKVPKKLLFDPGLTPKERIVWMVLAGHQYKSKSSIFPSRRRIAAMLGIKDIRQVSKMTRSLQDKAYLSKEYASRSKKVFYSLFFSNNVEEHPYQNNEVEEDRTLSKHNRIQGTVPQNR